MDRPNKCIKIELLKSPTSKLQQLLPVVKHLRTDGPQPIVLTSDADTQRLAAGGRPGADKVQVMVEKSLLGAKGLVACEPMPPPNFLPAMQMPVYSSGLQKMGHNVN